MRAAEDRPWMRALEMQYIAARTTAEAVSKYGDQFSGHAFDVMDRIAAEVLPRATAFAWDATTTQAVWLASQSIPLETPFERDLAPEGCTHCWWWFDWPLPIPMTDRTPVPVDNDHICSLLLWSEPGHAMISFDGRFCDARKGPMMTGMLYLTGDGRAHTLADVMSGKGWNPDTGTIRDVTPRAVAISRFVLAACVWLRQRIVSVGDGHIERHRRKQFARELDAPLPPDVKVVQLRRYESPESQPGESGSVDWSCRWIVNGHWRNQVYANNEHRLIYISPYVKGPSDKPLRIPTQTVYDVSR